MTEAPHPYSDQDRSATRVAVNDIHTTLATMRAAANHMHNSTELSAVAVTQSYKLLRDAELWGNVLIDR